MLKINPLAASRKDTYTPREVFPSSLLHTQLRGTFPIYFSLKTFLNRVNSGNRKNVAGFVIKPIAMGPLGSFHLF